MGSSYDSVKRKHVAVLGSGPIGLEAALAALDGGYEVTAYEASERPAGNVRDWGHVRLFTPWSMNASRRMLRFLDALGIPLAAHAEATPTGHELADLLLDPIWGSARLAPRLKLGSRVVAVGREGVLKHEEIASDERAQRPFRILLRNRSGREWVERADVVLDCTGKYGNPNTLGDAGIPAPGEWALRERIERRLPDLAAHGADWLGRTILLAGSGHSAQTAARDLAELASGRADTHVLWVLRKSDPAWGTVEDDPLSARRELAAAAEALAGGVSPAVTAAVGAVVDGLSPENGRTLVKLRDRDGQLSEVKVDRILSLTGGVGDHTLSRELQVHECYAFAAPMKLSAALLGSAGGDCLAQESHGVDTLKNPEPNFFILGDKSYGRNNTFLLQVGWQQVAEVFEELGANR